MEAIKYTVTIKIEVLSLDAVPGMVIDAMKLLREGEEKIKGSISAADGDYIEWDTESAKVTF